MTPASVAGLRVLVVMAHPDDESLACGGTIATLSRLGAHVRVFCATRGEAGHRNPALVASSADLPAIRTLELAAACAQLGVARHDLFDFPDGDLPWSGAERLIDCLAACLREWRPGVVVTFGRDGLYWHPDHIALGERVRTAIARCSREVPLTAYAVVMPPGAMAEVVAWCARRVPGVDPTLWGVPPEAFGKGALPGTRIVDVSAVIDTKLAALRCHASQFDAQNPLAHLTAEAARPMATEHFHLLETSPLHRSAFDVLAKQD